ncbi:MAG: S-methyl-5-thioribose-1-phosphate isomerase [Chloroflexota bacterium]
MRSVYWDYDNNLIRMIDQRRLPNALEIFTCHTYQEVVFAISNMVVRGAPAIGVSAAFGLALAAQQSTASDLDALISDLEVAKKILNNSRPTAINLTWGLNRVMEVKVGYNGSVDNLRRSLLLKAQEIADDDVILNKRMAEIGAELINDGDTIIHHCNTGALATVDWGTALGVIRTAHERGKRIHVLVDETRPRLQGSRLTAWELEQYDIPYQIITDNMAGFFLKSGEVNKVLFGADRVAANGDVANKIGTYMLALAARENNVPVYAILPTSTVDYSLENGDMIPIEERPEEEVLELFFKGERVTPIGAHARNPAFDVTPNRLITAIVTEKGLVYPPYKQNLQKFIKC